MSKASPSSDLADLTLLSSSYPIVFTVLVLPLSIVRFKTSFSAGAADKHNIPDAATFAVQFIYSLSGAVNVALFLTTRSGLLFLHATPGISAALRECSPESDIEMEQVHSRTSGSVTSEDRRTSV